MLFTLRLAQIKLSEEPICEQLFDLFLKPVSILEPRVLPLKLMDGRITKSQVAALEELTFLKHFPNLADHLQDNEDRWISMFDHPLAEDVVPEPWMDGDDPSVTNKTARILKKLIVIKILRPDRLLASVNQFFA